MAWNNPILQAVFWSVLTIALFQLGKRAHRGLGRWWSSPLLSTPLALIAVALSLHETYGEYIHETHWLVVLLGPATVAFAIPIWEQRDLIRKRWPILLAGVLTGSLTAMASAWAFATWLGLNDSLTLSLLPRSMSTPFAMTVSGEIGGTPDLTAVFVVITGVFGAALGEIILKVLPLRSALARGALFGMGAHGAGVAKAHGIGREEGAVAGLVLVLVGLLNVLAAPLLAHVF